MLNGIAHRYQVFIVCAAGIFLTVFDSSSAIVALPTIAAEFGTDLPTVQWVILGNSLTIAALLVPMGRLSDLIGRKRIYVVGCLIFGLCSLLAAVADSITVLIAARVLVGIGSGMTQGTAMALLVGNFELRERARMLGLQMGGVGLGAMAGPGIGGLIVGIGGWRTLFLATAAGMLTVAVAAQRVLRRRVQRPAVDRKPFDFSGAALFSLMLAAGLLTLTLGPGNGWSSPATLAGIGLFFLLAVTLFLVERRHPAPMLDFALLRRPDFAFGALSAVIAFMCISSMRFLAPFFFQAVKGYSPSQVGMLMLPAAITTAVTGPFVGGYADRAGVRLVANVGFVVSMIGLATFTATGTLTPTWVVVGGLVIMGFGMASFGAPNSAAILNAVDAESHGVGAGFVNLCRNTGNVIGIAVGTAVVTLTMQDAGFAASLTAVGRGADALLLAAFADGIGTTALLLLAVAIPVAGIVITWSARRARQAPLS
jgi:EmrB/QacA subfamily drug resistance transporter